MNEELESVVVDDSPVVVDDSPVVVDDSPDNQTINYQELVNTLLQDIQGVGSDDQVSEGTNTVEDSPLDESVSDSDFPSVQITQDISDFESQNALAFTSPCGGSELPSIGTSAPDSLDFYGSIWISGTDSSLGAVTLYWPIDSKNSWGLDSNGYLVFVGSGSVTGYLDGVYNNSLSCSSFSYPRYRVSNSYDYQYLHLIPDNSNAPIAVSDVPRVGISDALPLFIAAMLGVIVLFTSRSRH